MNDQTELSALRRKAGAGRDPSDAPGMTPSKAFRLAVSKAAEVEHGMAARVTAVTEVQVAQTQLLEALNGDALLIMLEGPEGGKGIATFDLQALSALIEVQTLGNVIAAEATVRAPTRTDSAMCEPMLDRILMEFEGHLADSNAAVWATGFRFYKQIGSLRLVALALEEIPYRLFDLQLDLSDGAKQGVMQIALPADGVSRKKTATSGDDGWAQALENAVGASHVEILAVLHRVHKSLVQVQGLQVGDEILVPKSNISAVSMEGTDGRVVGLARLGQQNGFRALRITADQATSQQPHGAQTMADPAMDLPAPDMPVMDMPTMDAPASDMAATDFPAMDMPTLDMAEPMAMGGLDPLPDSVGMDAMAVGAPMGDLPDLPMMPMENLPDDGGAVGEEEQAMASPMAAMPMDIEIA